MAPPPATRGSGIRQRQNLYWPIMIRPELLRHLPAEYSRPKSLVRVGCAIRVHRTIELRTHQRSAPTVVGAPGPYFFSTVSKLVDLPIYHFFLPIFTGIFGRFSKIPKSVYFVHKTMNDLCLLTQKLTKIYQKPAKIYQQNW